MKFCRLEQNAVSDTIKKAFRRMAQLHHPDKHDGSPESQLRFRIIREAYETLADPGSRKEYDTYLKTSSVYKKRTAAPALSEKMQTAAEELCGRLNYILWEIEDLLQGNSTPDGGPAPAAHPWLMRILAFFDEEILEPAGFPDYFYEARQIRADRYTDRVIQAPDRKVHKPYISIRDNFYQIRKRMDRMIDTVTDRDLNRTIRKNGIRLIDAAFEGLKLAWHYLGGIHLLLQGETKTIVPYIHTDARFHKENAGVIGE